MRQSVDSRQVHWQPIDVAVVIAAYQAEIYLAQCVESVLAQSLTSLHVVIVDDGSTDGTLRVARACGDPRVSVVTGPNRGPAHARNHGVRESPLARYVAFLDADDVWDREKLEVQTRHLDEHPELVAVGCRMRYISSAGRPLGTTGQLIDDEAQAAIARGELFPFHTSSIVVRRQVFCEINGFDEFLGTQGSEDLDLYARLARRRPLACLPAVLGSVRIHRDSFMMRRRRDVNRAARFVRLRLQSRDRGRDLTWAEFLERYPPTWRERRRDVVERAYRRAGLMVGERHWPRAAAWFGAALLIDPRYTIARAYRQRRGGGDSGHMDTIAEHVPLRGAE
jgi:glycosyltransferase involved in cell wall biosynthesis